MNQPTKAAPAENPAPPTKPIGVMIATPLRQFRGPEDLPKQIGRTLRELASRPDARGYSFEFAAACGGLCSARNRLAHDFLASDATWLLPWDADLNDQRGREADAILRLLSHRQPIVGGIYCKRAKRAQWVLNWLNGAKLQAGGLLQVAELGGGFKLYHRRVFSEIKRLFGDEPFADPERKARSILYRERETGEVLAAFYQIVNVEGDLLSEDYWLDYLCRCAGVPIIADTVVRLRQVEPDGKQYPDGAWPPIPAEDGQ